MDQVNPDHYGSNVNHISLYITRRMSKLIIIVRGACGAGKTTWVKEQWRNGISEHVDFADMLDLEWWERPKVAAKRAIESNAQLVFIEGILGPGAPSYEKLRRDLDPLEGSFILKEIVIHRPFRRCKADLEAQSGNGDRLDLLRNYWHKFEHSSLTKNKLMRIK